MSARCGDFSILKNKGVQVEHLYFFAYVKGKKRTLKNRERRKKGLTASIDFVYTKSACRDNPKPFTASQKNDLQIIHFYFIMIKKVEIAMLKKGVQLEHLNEKVGCSS